MRSEVREGEGTKTWKEEEEEGKKVGGRQQVVLLVAVAAAAAEREREKEKHCMKRNVLGGQRRWEKPQTPNPPKTHQATTKKPPQLPPFSPLLCVSAFLHFFFLLSVSPVEKESVFKEKRKKKRKRERGRGKI